MLKAAGIIFVTAWIFYHNLLAAVPLIPVLIWLYRHMEQDLIEKKKQEFLLQFKEMIQAVSSALNTGYSVENALQQAAEELSFLYKKDTVIMGELQFMLRQMQLMVPMEQVFADFAQRVQLEDVHNFATVFLAAKRSGGDMIAIIRSTADKIGDKIDVRREIDTALASGKYELQVMTVVPYGMILYMMFSFPEFMNSLYGNLFGMGVMTVCLVVYMAAYVLGTKLIKVEV